MQIVTTVIQGIPNLQSSSGQHRGRKLFFDRGSSFAQVRASTRAGHAQILCLPSSRMIHLLLIWLLSSLALLIVAYIVPGFELASFGSALIASIVVGFLNATLGFLLKLLTFPISILTLGIFFLVINAIILLLASALVPGFHIRGFWAAFLGAIVLMLVRMAFRLVMRA